MINVIPTVEQFNTTKELVMNHNFGQRGKGDGSRRMQAIGIMGQIMFADLLHHPRPTGENGFDGGYDFVIDGKRVDLKTMARTVDVKPHYVHNFVGWQLKYDCEYYVFASYNTEKNILSICGVIKKDDFLKKATYYNQGDKRYRDDGTFFLARTPLYEIGQSDLAPLNSLDDLHEYLQNH